QAIDPSQPSIGAMGTYRAEGSPLLNGESPALGRAMTIEDIETAIEDYAEAASHALDAGFDGVQLHGAHGYLIDQFLWGESNRRDDDYGGDTLDRTRFAQGLIAAVRAPTGPHFPVGPPVSRCERPPLCSAQ